MKPLAPMVVRESIACAWWRNHRVWGCAVVLSALAALLAFWYIDPFGRGRVVYRGGLCDVYLCGICPDGSALIERTPIGPFHMWSGDPSYEVVPLGSAPPTVPRSPDIFRLWTSPQGGFMMSLKDGRIAVPSRDDTQSRIVFPRSEYWADATWSPDGSVVAVVDHGAWLTLAYPSTGKCGRVAMIPRLRQVHFLDAMRVLMVADGQIAVYGMREKRLIRRFAGTVTDFASTKTPECIASDPRGAMVLVGGPEGMSAWVVATGRCIWSKPFLVPGSPYDAWHCVYLAAAMFDTGSGVWVTYEQPTMLRVRSQKDGHVIREYDVGAAPDRGVAWLPGRAALLYVSGGSDLRVVDAAPNSGRGKK